MPKRERKFEKKEVAQEPVTEELKTEEKPKKKPVKKDPKTGIVKIGALNVRTAPEEGNNILGVILKDAEVTINTDIPAPDGWYNITVELIPGVKATGYVMSKYIGVK